MLVLIYAITYVRGLLWRGPTGLTLRVDLFSLAVEAAVQYYPRRAALTFAYSREFV